MSRLALLLSWWWVSQVLVLRGVSGWGEDGHIIVANIAYSRLPPSVRKAVDGILLGSGNDNDEGSPLANVANWADRVRFTKAYHWSGPLHYVDVRDEEIDGGCPCIASVAAAAAAKHETSKCSFVYQRDCQHDFCAVGAIANYTRRLHHGISFVVSSSSTTDAAKNELHSGKDPMVHVHFDIRNNNLRGSAQTLLDRDDSTQHSTREALMFLTHFVGDVHQPLHCARGSDRGGNDITVKFDHPYHPHHDGRPDGHVHDHWNLHSVWDSGIIQRAIHELYHDSRHEYESYIFQEIINDKQNQDMIKKWLQCSNGQDIHCSSLWAEESLDDALMYAYDNMDGTEVTNGSELTDEYYKTRLPVVTRRLAAAGVRLAATLEAVFMKKMKNDQDDDAVTDVITSASTSEARSRILPVAGESGAIARMTIQLSHS